MEKNKIERKDIVKIDDQEVVFESLKDFNEFRKHYNKYDFMQNKQINTWETKLKEAGSDPIPEPTIRDMLIIINNLTLEMREGFRRVEQRLDAHDLEFAKIHNILERNNLK